MYIFYIYFSRFYDGYVTSFQYLLINFTSINLDNLEHKLLFYEQEKNIDIAAYEANFKRNIKKLNDEK